MTIRKKIFLLAGILLALFGVVVGALAYVQKLDSEQLNNITQYEMPLSRLVAQIDVYTDRYELGLLRLLRLEVLDQQELDTTTIAKQALEHELRADITAASALLAKAIQDPSYHTAERVELARVEGSFKFLVRNLEGFLATGDQVMAALTAGRRDEARAASLGFAKYAQAFGPDLSEIRRNLASLTDQATRSVLARQRLNTYLSFGLFIAACGVGLGVSAIGSARVVGGLRQLVASTRAIESGRGFRAAVDPNARRSRRTRPVLQSDGR